MVFRSRNWMCLLVCMFWCSAVLAQSTDVDSLIDPSMIDNLLDSIKDSESAEQGRAVDEDALADAASGQALGTTLMQVQSSLKEAGESLRAGDTGKATQASQLKVVLLLREFLDQSRQQSSQDQQSSSESQQSQQDQTSQQQQQQPEGSEASDRKEQKTDGESGQRVGSSESVVVKAAPVEGLRESVWGHLPERMRGQLRASLPEGYLPSYRDAITEYFRRLALDPKESTDGQE